MFAEQIFLGPRQLEVGCLDASHSFKVTGVTVQSNCLCCIHCVVLKLHRHVLLICYQSMTIEIRWLFQVNPSRTPLCISYTNVTLDKLEEPLVSGPIVFLRVGLS